MNQKYVYAVALGHFFCDIGMWALPAILPFFILQSGMDYQAVAGFPMFASCFLSSIVQTLWLFGRPHLKKPGLCPWEFFFFCQAPQWG